VGIEYRVTITLVVKLFGATVLGKETLCSTAQVWQAASSIFCCSADCPMAG
jgi:hypothetical protein